MTGPTSTGPRRASSRRVPSRDSRDRRCARRAPPAFARTPSPPRAARRGAPRCVAGAPRASRRRWPPGERDPTPSCRSALSRACRSRSRRLSSCACAASPTCACSTASSSGFDARPELRPTRPTASASSRSRCLDGRDALGQLAVEVARAPARRRCGSRAGARARSRSRPARSSACRTRPRVDDMRGPLVLLLRATRRARGALRRERGGRSPRALRSGAGPSRREASARAAGDARRAP